MLLKSKVKLAAHRFGRKSKTKGTLALLGLGSLGGYVYVLLAKAKKKMDEAAESTKASAERHVDAVPVDIKAGQKQG